MGTFRLYTGSDNESHIDPVDLSQTPDWMQAQDTTHITFRAVSYTHLTLPTKRIV